MTDSERNTRNWVIAIVSAIVVMTFLMLGATIAADSIRGGPAARRAAISADRVLQGQKDAKNISDCKTAYASSEAAAATKYRHAQTSLIIAASGIGPTDIPAAIAEIKVADREQVHYARLRLRSNDLCDPPGDAPPILPPPIDPPEVSP